MRTALKVSVFVNLALLSFLAWKLAGERTPPSDSVAAVASQAGVAESATLAPVSEAPVVKRVDAAVFRWSQIESPDYRVYIKNLRDIGCPELTIRDIITADVDSLFKARRRELEERLAALREGPLSVSLGSQPALEAELRQLPGEESALIAELLGLQTAPLAQDEPAPTPTPRRHSPPERPISMPLVFANVDPASVQLDETRLQAIRGLKERFIDELGGPGQDPHDPAYLERWQKAQPEIDGMLRGMIGMKAFEQYDLAARASLQSGSPGTP